MLFTQSFQRRPLDKEATSLQSSARLGINTCLRHIQHFNSNDSRILLIIMLLKIIFVALLTTRATARSFNTTNLKPRTAASAASQLIIIAPNSDSCASAPIANECETAVTAAPFLINAFEKYAVYEAPEMAALISLIAYETDGFQYAINHFPGRAGQGTRNMQMSNYNLMYAQSIPALKAPLAAITSATSTTGLSDDVLNAIRALVLRDEYAWASAAWFYTTQCDTAVRTALQAGGQAGYEAYLGCVGTTASQDRLDYWSRANTAFGIS